MNNKNQAVLLLLCFALFLSLVINNQYDLSQTIPNEGQYVMLPINNGKIIIGNATIDVEEFKAFVSTINEMSANVKNKFKDATGIDTTDVFELQLVTKTSEKEDAKYNLDNKSEDLESVFPLNEEMLGKFVNIYANHKQLVDRMLKLYYQYEKNPAFERKVKDFIKQYE